jgi:hypothetical protein
MVLFFAGSYFFIKHRLDSLNKIDESEKKLETVYGSVYDFTPDLDLNYSSQRIKKFLEIRSSLSSESAELDSAMLVMQKEIEGVVDDPSFWDAITIIKGGFELIPDIVSYFLARNEALINNQMGLGEYNYIYYNAYYVVLDKSPSDGPKFRLEGEGEDQDERYGETVFDDRLVKISRRVNHLAREHLKNLKEMLEVTDPSNIYLPIVEEELSRLLSDRNYLPWSSNKPDFVTAPFQDYLTELNGSYNPLLNPLELTDIE